YFEKPVPTTILVICYKYKSLDKRLKVTKILEKNAILFESKPLPENKIPAWAEQYLERKGYKITSKASWLLAEYLGTNLEQIVNALNKLCDSMDKGSIIDEKDVADNVGINRDYNVFELTAAMADKDIAKVTKLVNYINRNEKEYPMPMMAGIFYGFFSKA